MEWTILKINFSIVGCDGHVMGYRFVKQRDSQSILATVIFSSCSIDVLYVSIFYSIFNV